MSLISNTIRPNKQKTEDRYFNHSAGFMLINSHQFFQSRLLNPSASEKIIPYGIKYLIKSIKIKGYIKTPRYYNSVTKDTDGEHLITMFLIFDFDGSNSLDFSKVFLHNGSPGFYNTYCFQNPEYFSRYKIVWTKRFYQQQAVDVIRTFSFELENINNTIIDRDNSVLETKPAIYLCAVSNLGSVYQFPSIFFEYQIKYSDSN